MRQTDKYIISNGDKSYRNRTINASGLGALEEAGSNRILVVIGINKKKKDNDGFNVGSGEWLETGKGKGLAKNIKNSRNTFSL